MTFHLPKIKNDNKQIKDIDFYEKV